MSTTSGDTVNLTVNFKDATRVEWYHNDKKISSSPKTRITTEDGSSTLTISGINSNEIGLYKLVAFNGSRSMTTQCTLAVEAPLLVAEETSEETETMQEETIPDETIPVLEGEIRVQPNVVEEEIECQLETVSNANQDLFSSNEVAAVVETKPELEGSYIFWIQI